MSLLLSIPGPKREACLDPESPPTKNTDFETGCAACMLALKAAISQPPPPGAFAGWWDSRDAIRAAMLERGIEL